QPRTEEVSRRQALGRMVFSTAGLFGASAAVAQVAKPIQVAPVQIEITTEAVNEEGARKMAAATTAPFGEEAGRVTSFVVPGLEDGGAAPAVDRTKALNEQGGNPVTQALNENGIRPLTRARNEEGVDPKTKAVKEEGIQQPAPAPIPVPKTPPVQEDKLQIQVQPVQGKPAQIQLQPVQGKPIQIQVQPVAPPMATTLAIGEEGGVTTRALNEEGGVGGRTVIVPPMARDLNTQQLEALWKQLGEANEAAALQACAAIYGSKQAITFLKGKLKTSVKAADTETVARLIKDLDNDSFDVREKAAKDLADLGVSALPALQEVMNQPASAEVHARIRRLLDQSKDMPAFLQLQRGVEILVALKNEDAKKLTQELADQKPATLVTALANQALPRMK
ncbi:MAG: hypothetical protein AB7K24_33885, partial [Gemmataceae bacterium]